MKTVLVIMTGIGFTLGVVFGLLLQLPIDTSLTGNAADPQERSFKSRRSLSEEQERAYMILQHQNAMTIRSPARQFTARNGTEINQQNIEMLKEEDFNIKIELIKKRKSRVNDLKNNRTVSQHFQHGPGRSQIVNKVGDDSRSATPNGSKYFNHSASQGTSLEDLSYLSSVVSGVHWTSKLEASCPRSFSVNEVKDWRKRVDRLDVVKMEEGCGRMQNRLLTFRDSSKACARYRLNADQIQGEIYSYYLAQLLNITNMPPTQLMQVDPLSQKWRTVHLQLSLAQWADSKIVVLTQHLGGLSPAHIPLEFREENRRLEPTLTGLGGKTHDELCELTQWSDLIVFDYLTANLDRVINNMFNKQWNDQMMSNPAHNLEKHKDGTLVFLDNESGLFHGYRLLDKYAGFHRTLLSSLCVFRPDTARGIKRLHESGSIGRELLELFASQESLHKHIAVLPEKNIKVLQQRLDDVYQQIVKCEQLFGR